MKTDNKEDHHQHYDPLTYWTERGKKYMEQFNHKNPGIERQERLLMQYLDSNENIFSGRVLEVGAGFGRISKLVLERFHKRIEEYILVDVSKDQLYNARVYLSSNLEPSVLQSVTVKFIQCDFMDFVNADKFDLVLAAEVLMHVLPKDIERAVNGLVSLSKKDVLSVDWYEDAPERIPLPEKVAAHNFIHDYMQLYRKNEDVETVVRMPIREDDSNKKTSPEQSLFHVRVRTPS